MLASQFEGIKMQDDETFNEFHTKISYLRNSMMSLGRKISYAKLIKRILRSLPERFKIKVTTIEESKDLDAMNIEELVRSLQTYEFSLPLPRRSNPLHSRLQKVKAEFLQMKTPMKMTD
jgi:hypothetical protein